MATVLDAFVVELGLDPTKFQQGQKEAYEALRNTTEQAVKGGKEIEAQGAKVSEYFNGVKRQALGLAALLVGGAGVKEFVQNITTADAATARMSRILNISAKELSAWQGAARLAGGSAESITGSLHGFNQEMNRFMLTGEASFLPALNAMGIGILDEQGKIKTTTQLLIEMSDAMEKMNAQDQGRASAHLSMIPGMNQETINLLLKGPDALRRMLADTRSMTSVTKESADQAERLASAWARTQIYAENLGRTILDKVSPALLSLLAVVIYLGAKISGAPLPKEDPGEKAARLRAEEASKAPARSFMDRLGKRETMWESLRRLWAAPEDASAAPRPQSLSTQDQEAYIRSAAAARGIDPNVAVAVARSEGLGEDYQSKVRRKDGSREESFGPFQLFMGGGLGNKFQGQTGLDPRDPSTVKSQIDFSLDEAKKSGWGAWHGWKGLPFQGIEGGGRRMGSREGDRTSSVTTHIGEIKIVTAATDAQGIASEVGALIRRANEAASANYALTG